MVAAGRAGSLWTAPGEQGGSSVKKSTGVRLGWLGCAAILSCAVIYAQAPKSTNSMMAAAPKGAASGEMAAKTPELTTDDLGAFLRAGWNDGRTEDFAFTEVDQLASFGGQLSGTRWSRSDDRLMPPAPS